MNHTFDFDPQLPALPLAFDIAAVARLFVEQWPRAEAGPVEITKCNPQDTKYQPGRRCATTYALTSRARARRRNRRLACWRSHPPAQPSPVRRDPKLPWLARATDPQVMRERFGALLGTPVEDCAITPVRYRPGVRCVFRYDLRTAAGQPTFFGKLIGQGAEHLMATIAALHNARAASPEHAAVLPPLAYWPELHMLVQAEVTGGAELNDLAFDPGRGCRNARALAARCRRAPGRAARLQCRRPTRTIADDLDELHEYVAPIAAVDPALAERYAAAVERLAEASANDEPAPVASHGAFRTDRFT